MTTTRHFRTLGLLITICILLIIPTIAAWLVNTEIALQAVGIPCALLAERLPASLYGPLVRMATDLSTISTLVPLLILIFPIFMGIRIRVLAQFDPGYLHRVVYDPYPPHIPFFLVMLGLTGTLYGLLIGLSVSGVADLGTAAPTASAIQETIDRLMDGTATALLSSLLGLVGAFLAARPLTWMFRKAAGITEDQAQRTVTDVITSLTHDLQSLSHASREFSEHLNVVSAEDIKQRITQIENSLTFLAKGLTESNTTFQKLLDVQQQIAGNMERMKHLNELQRLENIENATTETSQRLAESQQSLDQMRALIDNSTRNSREDRSALRNALSDYIQNMTEKSE